MTGRTLFLLAWVFVGLAWRATGQDFSEMLLTDGREAYRGHRPADAIDPLRISAFGLLDRPALLCEALVFLALANEASGRHADAQSALERLSDVQRRFPACAEARLDNAARSDFESRFHRRLPASVPVASTPVPTPPKPGPPLQSQVPEPSPRPAREREAGAEGEGERPVRIKKSVPPVYPRAAREAGVGGTVILRVLVSEAGKAMQVEVVRGVRPDLADAAVVAMQYWTFEPARRNGREIAAWTTIEVPFQP